MEFRILESARVIKVIETKCTRGDGTSADPVRTVYQYWSVDGKLLAEMTMIFKQSNTFGIKRERAARERKTRIEVIL